MKTTKKFQINRVMLFVGLVFLTSQLVAQSSYVVKGRILNTEKQPVNYATATLQDSETMEIVGDNVCDENGLFTIENVKPGEYILSVRKEGFSKIESKRIVIGKNGTYTEKKNNLLNEWQTSEINNSYQSFGMNGKQSNEIQVNGNEKTLLVNYLGAFVKELQSKNLETI